MMTKLYNSIIYSYGKGTAERIQRKSLKRLLFRKLGNIIFPILLSSNKKYSEQKSDYIISLTSFPARIANVWKVILCLKKQSICPNKIILWLSSEQFSDKGSLPTELTRLEDNIFEIRFVDGDIKSHKKHYYVFQEYSNHPIVLVDDDIYYPLNMLERFNDLRKHNEELVICRYGFIMSKSESGRLNSYDDWLRITGTNMIDKSIFFGTGGGTCFPPKFSSEPFSDIKRFIELTPTADDIWINACTRFMDYEVCCMENLIPFPVFNKNSTCLSSVNNGQMQNDAQIKKVSSFFKSVYNKDVF